MHAEMSLSVLAGTLPFRETKPPFRNQMLMMILPLPSCDLPHPPPQSHTAAKSLEPDPVAPAPLARPLCSTSTISAESLVLKIAQGSRADDLLRSDVC